MEYFRRAPAISNLYLIYKFQCLLIEQCRGKSGIAYTRMGGSCQDFSWIQDFEADFPKKVSLKRLNSSDYNSFLIYFQFL